jgi:hypothetical protein
MKELEAINVFIWSKEFTKDVEEHLRELSAFHLPNQPNPDISYKMITHLVAMIEDVTFRLIPKVTTCIRTLLFEFLKVEFSDLPDFLEENFIKFKRILRYQEDMTNEEVRK